MTEFGDICLEELPIGERQKQMMDRKTKAYIRLKPECTEIPYQRPYKMSAIQLQELRRQLQELMDKGFIRSSSSPYGAPVMLVPKPHQPGKLRMVVDYRALNRQLVRDRYPLPTVEQMIIQLKGLKLDFADNTNMTLTYIRVHIQ